jgi:hypothetical protein
MATASFHNGEWTDWSVVKIKGEKGEKGDDGTSVKINGNFESINQMQVE